MPDILIAAIARMAGGATTETILEQCGDLETSRLMLFTAENPRHGSAVGSGSQGTGFADTPRVDYLKDIGILPDAAYYYNIAIDEGRCVITYNTTAEDAPLIEERFRACGFVKVRRFALTRTVAEAAR